MNHFLLKKLSDYPALDMTTAKVTSSGGVKKAKLKSSASSVELTSQKSVVSDKKPKATELAKNGQPAVKRSESVLSGSSDSPRQDKLSSKSGSSGKSSENKKCASSSANASKEKLQSPGLKVKAVNEEGLKVRRHLFFRGIHYFLEA
jgi:hypothetical protein